MQSTITRHDDGKPAVAVEKAVDVKRELKIPSRKQARTMLKKRALLIVTFTDEDGEQWDYVVKPMSPMEAANAFGSAFGKSAAEASRKLAEGDIDEEEAAKEALEGMSEGDSDINPLDEFSEKVKNALITNVILPDDLEEEDIDEMEFELKVDLFNAITRSITGSGDSVDGFPTVDNESEESTRSDDN